MLHEALLNLTLPHSYRTLIIINKNKYKHSTRNRVHSNAIEMVFFVTTKL